MLGAIAASAKVPVYIMAGQSNADGRALVCEMPESIQDYVKNGGSDLIMMSYCNGSTRKTLGVIEKYVKSLVAHLRRHIVEKAGDEKYAGLPFIAGSVNPQSRQYDRQVEEGKLRLAGEDPNFHVVDLDGCELRSDDHLHFNAAGCVEAGTRMYDKLTELGLVSDSI